MPTKPKPILPATMRALHGELRVHGISTDEAVHAYIAAALGDKAPASRKDLTEEQGRAMLADLAEAPRLMTPELLAQLRRPFPEQAIGKLPRSTCQDCSNNRGTCTRHPRKGRCGVCGNYHNDTSTMHLDFVGHADVTDRLLEVDPHWSWRPMRPEELAAVPPVMRDAGLWIMLTVSGVTRPGFGDADGKRGGNAVKEAIGDALRNGAMRFGVALDLWAKGDREWAHAEKDDVHPSPDPTTDRAEAPAYQGPDSFALVQRLEELAVAQGTDLDALTAKFRSQHGNIETDTLTTVDAPLLLGLVQSIEAWIAKQAQAGQEASS